jgi:putative ABC transport system substrate-binding protein
MKRRTFIAFLGAIVPLSQAWTQPLDAPVIGFLNSASAGPWASYLTGFRNGLGERGFVEGKNVRIEYRWAEGHYDRLPSMAADLVNRKVAVIVSSGGVAPARAAKAATSVIPIVFGIGDDPVRLGIVPNLHHPGGNVTGINYFVAQMESKRFGLLRELVPSASLIAVLMNPNNPPFPYQLRDVQEAARAMGQQIHLLQASNESELEAAFATAKDVHAGAMLVAGDPYFNSSRNKIIALAARFVLPAIYEQRQHAEAGGLMSYGTSLTDGYRQLGNYTGRVLKGEKPGDLPVMQSSKFEFVINLKTAKALGLTVPLSMVSRADAVIE